MALAFAEIGDHVVLTDVLDAGSAAAAGIAASGGSAEFHPIDVRDTASIDALVQDICARRGGLDVAIANAGVALRRPLDEMDDNAWDATIDINLTGSMRILRAAGQVMKTRQGGCLIAVSSISARKGWPAHIHYNASKAGIEGLIVGLAVELGPFGIRANAILPGLIRTAQSLSEEHSLGMAGLEAAVGSIPLRRIGEPEDIAGIAVFLASASAGYLTGQSIVVDGGLTVSSF